MPSEGLQMDIDGLEQAEAELRWVRWGAKLARSLIWLAVMGAAGALGIMAFGSC